MLLFVEIGTDTLRRVPAYKSPPVCNYSQECKEQEMITVDYDYVKKAVNNTRTLIIDVREPEELIEHGYIPSSINIPCKCFYNTILLFKLLCKR